MLQAVAVGLDSPLVHCTLLMILGTEAQVTMASAAGRTLAVGRLDQNRDGRWLLLLANPYEGPPPTVVHLRVESHDISLEAPVLAVLSPGALLLGSPNWLQKPQSSQAVRSGLSLSTRYAVAGSREWHSGRVVAVGQRYLLLHGPVLVAPGAVCALRITLGSSPLPLSLRAWSEWAAEEGGLFQMHLQLRGLSAQAERLLEGTAGPGEHGDGRRVMAWTGLR
ncbi:MAG: hypothetical protein ACOY94_19135 [Bacillota bacterium]